MEIRNQIFCGDVMEEIKKITDSSVDCIITSPPYYGLRDYGTASWEGGNKACDHALPNYERDSKNPEVVGHMLRHDMGNCHKCGAKRIDSQVGLEDTPEKYINKLVEVFRECRRILKPTGVCWLNLGDSYEGNNSRASNGGRAGFGVERGGVYFKGGQGLKPKDQMLIPHRVAMALQDDGWWVRDTIIWSKPNPMPSSCEDRCTNAFEYVFQLTKNQTYFFDNVAIKEECVTCDDSNRDRDNSKLNNTPGRAKMKGLKTNNYLMRNKRNVWTIATQPFKEGHFAVMPEELVRQCILAGSSEKGCCPDCGEPWVRIIESNQIKRERPNEYIKRNGEKGTGNSINQTIAGVETKTIGWEANCECGLKYNSKYKGKEIGQNPQGFTCTGSIEKERGASKRMAVELYPNDPKAQREYIKQVHDHGGIKHVVFKGFESNCACDKKEPVPCIIFDPFFGSGTVGVVARKLGRDFCGCELNAEYIKMAKRRIAKECGIKASEIENFEDSDNKKPIQLTL